MSFPPLTQRAEEKKGAGTYYIVSVTANVLLFIAAAGFCLMWIYNVDVKRLCQLRRPCHLREAVEEERAEDVELARLTDSNPADCRARTTTATHDS